MDGSLAEHRGLDSQPLDEEAGHSEGHSTRSIPVPAECGDVSWDEAVTPSAGNRKNLTTAAAQNDSAPSPNLSETMTHPLERYQKLTTDSLAAASSVPKPPRDDEDASQDESEYTLESSSDGKAISTHIPAYCRTSSARSVSTGSIASLPSLATIGEQESTLEFQNSVITSEASENRLSLGSSKASLSSMPSLTTIGPNDSVVSFHSSLAASILSDRTDSPSPAETASAGKMMARDLPTATPLSELAPAVQRRTSKDPDKHERRWHSSSAATRNVAQPQQLPRLRPPVREESVDIPPPVASGTTTDGTTAAVNFTKTDTPPLFVHRRISDEVNSPNGGELIPHGALEDICGDQSPSLATLHLPDSDSLLPPLLTSTVGIAGESGKQLGDPSPGSNVVSPGNEVEGEGRNIFRERVPMPTLVEATSNNPPVAVARRASAECPG